MNEKKMSIYHEIHRLHRLGFNKSQIERKVGVNQDTVRKYLEKDFEEMTEGTYILQNRTKKMDPYADIILEWLKELRYFYYFQNQLIFQDIYFSV
ncbi:hypothetical protein HW423_09980 [Aerococcaceae bacterium INB8]|uniref:HTH IS21-type domain-containing protein n=2 Tax=Ruoffia halotolerans TaxID=2748684 RepID=A0A839A8A4_9LACT|nr:hypothetical protein [Ruoffia halotolerans]